jgi:hypothetical protein
MKGVLLFNGNARLKTKVMPFIKFIGLAAYRRAIAKSNPSSTNYNQTLFWGTKYRAPAPHQV